MSFFTACAWVFTVLSVIRIVAVGYSIYKIREEMITKAQMEKIIDLVYARTRWPIIIILLSILWMVFGE